mgnify:CR=1 FL=1
MDIGDYGTIIKEVSEESGFSVDGNVNSFMIDVDRYHSVAYYVQQNNSGYLQVHQWEYNNTTGDGDWGRAIYSLRSLSDVVSFCSIILISSQLYARRPNY